MKIIDRETFKRMPKGTVFCKFPRLNKLTNSYDTYMFGMTDPMILDGPWDVDFYYTQPGFMTPVESSGSSEDDEIMMDMEQHLGKEVPFEAFSCRDGMFEDNDEVAFAIYSRQEVQEMIDLLQQALKDGYQEE